MPEKMNVPRKKRVNLIVNLRRTNAPRRVRASVGHGYLNAVILLEIDSMLERILTEEEGEFVNCEWRRHGGRVGETRLSCEIPASRLKLMPRRARIHSSPLKSSLVNLPLSLYGPLVQNHVVSLFHYLIYLI